MDQHMRMKEKLSKRFEKRTEALSVQRPQTHAAKVSRWWVIVHYVFQKMNPSIIGPWWLSAATFPIAHFSFRRTVCSAVEKKPICTFSFTQTENSSSESSSEHSENRNGFNVSSPSVSSFRRELLNLLFSIVFNAWEKTPTNEGDSNPWWTISFRLVVGDFRSVNSTQ